MAYRGFDGGFGFRHDVSGASRFYGDAFKAGSGSPWGNISRHWASDHRPFLMNKLSSGAFDHALASNSLQMKLYKRFATAHPDPKSSVSALTGLPSMAAAVAAGRGQSGLLPTDSSLAKLRSMIPDVAKARHTPTARQDIFQSGARIKELASAYGGLATKLDGLAATYGRYSGLNRLTATMTLPSGVGQTLRAADMFAAKASSFAMPAEGQLSGLRPFLKPSLGLYRIPPHDFSGLRSVLKSVTAYGPVVVTPEDDLPPPPSPSDYTPTLEGLIPETATSSDDAVTFEEAWLEVVTFGKAVAQHHHTKVLIRVIGTHGVSFLVQVAAGLFVFWITYNITH